MSLGQTLPNLWLLSDERNDAGLEAALAALPKGSGFVYRHYHLGPAERRARFDQLAGKARQFDHLVILSSARWDEVQDWGADGLYGASGTISAVSPPGLLRLATVHDAEEIAFAKRSGVDAIFLSPVFPTRSHPGAKALGIEGFHRLASKSEVPVIALGGMSAARAIELGWPRWAAIDGLS
jgi:thiamine-phosphate pyrophosphorylase